MPRRSSVRNSITPNKKSARRQSNTASLSFITPNKNTEKENFIVEAVTNTISLSPSASLTRKRVRASDNFWQTNDVLSNNSSDNNNNNNNNNNVNENNNESDTYKEDENVNFIDEDEQSDNVEERVESSRRWSYVRQSLLSTRDTAEPAETRFSTSQYVRDQSNSNDNSNVNSYFRSHSARGRSTHKLLEVLPSMYMRVGVLPLLHKSSTNISIHPPTKTENRKTVKRNIYISKETNKEVHEQELTKEGRHSVTYLSKRQVNVIERLLYPRRFFQLPSLVKQERPTQSFDNKISNNHNDNNNMSTIDPLYAEDNHNNSNISETLIEEDADVLGWSGKYVNVALPLPQESVICKVLTNNENKLKDKSVQECQQSKINTAISVTVVLEPQLSNNSNSNNIDFNDYDY